MPSRSRHSRNHNNHSNRSSNKNRNRHSTQSNQSTSDKSSNHHSKCNISKKQQHTSSSHQSTTSEKSTPSSSSTPINKSLPPDIDKTNPLSDIKEFENEIILEFKTYDLSILDLSLLLEKYIHRRNANALFLLSIICDFIIPNNLYLFEMECNDKIRNSFFKVLFNLTNKITFKNVINQNSWSLIIIKILQCGLPTLSSSLIHWIAKHIRIHNNNNNNNNMNIGMDLLRFIIMFLRPEIVEQSAELVQFNASIFEEVFRELINALSDNYQPFRIWLFHRLCSKKRNSRLIEPQLAQFICFGDKKLKPTSNNNNNNKPSKRAKSLLINVDDDDEKDNGMDLGRLMNAFKFCMDASNQLVINNQTRTYYELGHLILNDVISIASTLRCHFSLEELEFCKMIAIMHCNLGSIYLHQNKYDLALKSANKALEYDINCLQSYRIRAEYYIKYKNDINLGLNDLYQILSKDEHHPYAINMKKEIIKNYKLNNNTYIAKNIIKNNNNNMPCPREKHSAVNYRNDKLIIYGGCPIITENETENENENDTPLNDLWILDVNNNRWMQLDITGNITPCKRHSHTANIIQHKLYIIGGAKCNNIIRDNKTNTFDNVHNRIKKKIYNKINSDYYHFERNRNMRLRNNANTQLKMHRFSSYKNTENPKERVFALNSTNENGVTLETVVTFNKNKCKKQNKGYALGGWFTNFFKHENDEKIKELAAKGIIDDDISDNDLMVNDTDSVSMSTHESESDTADDPDGAVDSSYSDDNDEIDNNYEINTFPAIEMLDLKYNKWIRPETTGTSPKHIMINHRSIVVGKKIFIFPTNYSFPYEEHGCMDRDGCDGCECGYILYTDTLHWESFEIPKTHKIILEECVIPVLYDKKDKIMFVSMFDGKYYIHCLLFTKSPMEWSPIKKVPSVNKLSGYNRLTRFACSNVGSNYIVVHGGILKDKLYGKSSEKERGVEHINLLSKMPLDSDIIGNVIDGTMKEYDGDGGLYDDEYDEYDSYEFDDGDSEYEMDGNKNELQPLYCMNNEETHESRVSIVESLLFNKNPTEMHRIGPVRTRKDNNNNNNTINDDDECIYGSGNNNTNNNKIKTKISYKTTTRTIASGTNSKYKTTRTRTITTTHCHGLPNIPSPIDSLNNLKKKLLLTKREINIGARNNRNEIDENLFYNMRYCHINKYKNKYGFLSNFEVFDYVSMRWLPRISISYDNNIYNNYYIENHDDENNNNNNIELNLLEQPRINHTITMVGNNLCIFGGIDNSNVLIIENFMKNCDKLNKKFYKNYEKLNISIANENNECKKDTNALSLTKYLFGISPNIFSNGSYRMVQCANCLILECNRFNFRTCSGCAQVQYCSKLCQKNHWKLNHRHFCTKNHIRYQ